MIKRIVLTAIVLSLGLSAQELLDGIAAIVGDKIILQSDVEQFARLTASQMRIDPMQNPDQFQKIKNQALQALVDENILLEQAKLDTIEVKDRDIENMLSQQIDAIIMQAGSQERAEEILGSSISKVRRDYRPIIKNRLIVDKLRSEKFGKLTVTRDEVNQFYNTFRDSLPEIPQTLDFSHILFSVNAGAEEHRAAYKKADSLLTLLKNGADFAQIARRFSEDPGTAETGGDLGYIRRGGFIKSFEEVAFQLERGDLSDVVKTDFGYHIIQQLDRKGENINVRHILIKPKTTEANIQDARKLAENVLSQINNGLISFDSAAVKYSDDKDSKINRGRIKRIPKNQIQSPQFIEVLDTLKIGEVSKVFQTEMGFHILKLIGVYDETWKTLEQYALEYKRTQAYQDWLMELRKRFYIEFK